MFNAMMENESKNFVDIYIFSLRCWSKTNIITKWGKSYYKVGQLYCKAEQLLQSGQYIFKWTLVRMESHGNW